MARKNNSVVTIKNIDNEDFTHSYDGFSYTIRAGETLPFPYPVGMLLANHLARKMARKEAQKKTDFKSNTDKKSINLYMGTALEPYLNKIVIGKEDKPLPAKQSEGEVLAQKTKDLQKNFPKETTKPTVEKKDVIVELKKRNIKHDPRATKEALLELLTQAEMQGNTGDEDDDAATE